MKPELQRIAIAEACGWTGIYTAKRKDTELAVWYEFIAGTKPDGREEDVPYYLNDLKALHEAEETLTLRQCLEYTHLLGRMESTDTSDLTFSNRFGWHAAAAQRAESFLKVIGKWVED